MELGNISVNWVLDDEELLEPYEWKDDDDLEILSCVTIIRVNSDTMYDLYYCQLLLDKNHDFKIAIFSDGIHCIACEFDFEKRLKYRSLLMLEDRELIRQIIEPEEETQLKYEVLIYGENKELGLTRFEREKKQWILQELKELFQNYPDELVNIGKEYLHLDKIDKERIYDAVIDKLKNGYSPIHETLYLKLINN